MSQQDLVQKNQSSINTSRESSSSQTNRSDFTLLEITKLNKSFLSGEQNISILEEITLSIGSQESVALSGRSGSGKSTLIHLIAGVEVADQGTFLWKGMSLNQFTETQRAAWRLQEIGFLFQDFRLFPHLTALENVALPLELLGKTAQQGESEAQVLLTELGLADRVHHLPTQLSGGEQQRVALARALIHQPALILADEPTGNLDWRSAQQITDLLLSLPQSKKCSVLIVTHDLKLAQRAHRHFQIKTGKLEEVHS